MVKGLTFIVTGAAAGLGKAVVETLLSNGAFVTAIDIQNFSKDSFAAYKENVIFCKADICSEDDVSNALLETKKKFKKINGVISCAGICPGVIFVYDEETRTVHGLEDFKRTIDVNLVGTFNVIRLAIPYFIENEADENGQKGIIITTSSVAGNNGCFGLTAYATSKAAIQSLAYPLSNELSKLGVRIVDVAPGLCNTLMFKTIADDQSVGNVFPNRRIEPAEYGKFVLSIIHNPMLNGVSIPFSAALVNCWVIPPNLKKLK